MELVEALEVGNASAQNCHVAEVSAWPVLNRLEGKTVNLDEFQDCRDVKKDVERNGSDHVRRFDSTHVLSADSNLFCNPLLGKPFSLSVISDSAASRA